MTDREPDLHSGLMNWLQTTTSYVSTTDGLQCITAWPN